MRFGQVTRLGIVAMSLTMTLNFLPDPALAQAAAKKYCRADYERLCKNVPPGGGRIIACLKAHESELSPACAKALAGQ